MKAHNQNLIKAISAWFETAIPNPTSDSQCVQIGCHFVLIVSNKKNDKKN